MISATHKSGFTYLMPLGILFTSLLLTSNIIGIKLILLGPVELTSAFIIFPLTYIFGDIFTEVYGYAYTRQIIWWAIGCNILMTLATQLAIILPHPASWPHQEAFRQIFGYTPRVVLASILSFALGEFLNSYVMAKLKILTQGRWLWLRTISSTLVGQGVDSLTVTLITFSSMVGIQESLKVAFFTYAFKVGYEVISTPFIYLLVGFLKRVENTDSDDTHTDFTPFSLATPAKSPEESPLIPANHLG